VVTNYVISFYYRAFCLLTTL